MHQETFNCEPCEQKRQPDTSQATENPRSAPSWVNPYSTLAIAGLSLLTLVVLWRQFFLIRDIERAWVLVEIGETPVIPPTKIIWLMPKVRNRGSTPARIQKVSIRSRAVPSVQNLPVPPDYAPSINFEFVLAPQVEIRPMRVTFPSAEMQNPGSGQPALCIYGYVEYLDITNKRRPPSSFRLLRWNPSRRHGWVLSCRRNARHLQQVHIASCLSRTTSLHVRQVC